MGFFSFVVGAVSSVVSAVRRGVSAAYNTVKDVAGKAVGWLAEKAGNFVDGVKKVWETVKPYVAQIRTALKAAAAATAVSFPWLSGALVLLPESVRPSPTYPSPT